MPSFTDRLQILEGAPVQRDQREDRQEQSNDDGPDAAHGLQVRRAVFRLGQVSRVQHRDEVGGEQVIEHDHKYDRDDGDREARQRMAGRHLPT